MTTHADGCKWVVGPRYVCTCGGIVPVGFMLDDGRVQVRALTTRGLVALWLKDENGATHHVVLSPSEAMDVAEWLDDSAHSALEAQ